MSAPKSAPVPRRANQRRKKRSGRHVAVTAIIALSLTGSLLALGSSPAETAVRDSNVVVFMLDDLDLGTIERIVDETGGLNHEMFPNISDLAARGAFARNFFVNAVSCCPSRATFLLGTFLSENGIWSNNDREYYEPDPLADRPPVGGGYREFVRRGHERATIAVRLPDRYRTIGAGKYLNGYAPGKIDEIQNSRVCPNGRVALATPPGWNAWFGLLRAPHGLSSNGYNAYVANRNGCRVARADEDPNRFLEDTLEFSIKQIGAAVRNEKPFFLYYTPHNVHSLTPSNEIERRRQWVDFDRRKMFRDVRYYHRCGPVPFLDDEDDVYDGTPEDCTDLYSFNEGHKPGGIDEKPAWVTEAQSRRSHSRINRLYQDRLTALSAVDDALGRLLDKLESFDVLDSTTIFLTSDQGFKFNEHGIRSGKNTPYEEDIRAPLIVAGPGIPQGVDFTPMLSMVDLHATILDLAGVDADGSGLSFLDALRDGGDFGRDYVLVEGVRGDYSDAPKIGKPMNKFQAIRADGFKFIWTRRLDEQGRLVPGEDWVELYDLRSDPAEMRGLQPSRAQRTILTSAILACARGHCPPAVGDLFS